MYRSWKERSVGLRRDASDLLLILLRIIWNRVESSITPFSEQDHIYIAHCVNLGSPALSFFCYVLLYSTKVDLPFFTLSLQGMECRRSHDSFILVGWTRNY